MGNVALWSLWVRHIHTRGNIPTFPVVGSWGPKDQIVVVFSKGSRETLLARPESLMASRSALTELPVPPVLIGLGVDGQVLTQDVAAADDVTRLLARVPKKPPLVAVGTSLHKQKTISSHQDTSE